MKKWLLLVPLLLGLSLFSSGQAVTTLDQNCNLWGANPATPQCGGTTSATSGTQLFFPDIRGTITNQFEVLVQGTAPATLTVTVVGCMRGGTCSSTLASSSGTASQIVTPAIGSLNVYDRYGVTVSWTGGDATTRFVVNRTGTVAKLSGGAVPAGATNVIQKNGGAGTFAASSLTDNGTSIATSEWFDLTTSTANSSCGAWTSGMKLPGSGAGFTQLSGNPNGADICAGAAHVVQVVASTGDLALDVSTGSLFFAGGKGQHIKTQAAGNDISGTCTAAAATTCTVTFTAAYTAAPSCTVTDQTNITTVKAVPSTTTLVITTSASSSDVFSYICIGNPN